MTFFCKSDNRHATLCGIFVLLTFFVYVILAAPSVVELRL